MDRNKNSQNGAAGGTRRVLTVGLPDPHEGISSALRSTFGVTRQDIPADMAMLLRKLDRY